MADSLSGAAAAASTSLGRWALWSRATDADFLGRSCPGAFAALGRVAPDPSDLDAIRRDVPRTVASYGGSATPSPLLAQKLVRGEKKKMKNKDGKGKE